VEILASASRKVHLQKTMLSTLSMANFPETRDANDSKMQTTEIELPGLLVSSSVIERELKTFNFTQFRVCLLHISCSKVRLYCQKIKLLCIGYIFSKKFQLLT